MMPQPRHDLLFGLGYAVFLLGQLLKLCFPGVLANPGVVQTLYILGLGIFTVFFFVTLFAIARSRLPVRRQLLWIGALVAVAPVAAPLAYRRFVRSRVTAST